MTTVSKKATTGSRCSFAFVKSWVQILALGVPGQLAKTGKVTDVSV
jgi:hypothetical protein